MAILNDPTFWVAVAFVVFVILVYKPIGKGVAGALDTFDDVQLVDGALPTTFTSELHIDIDRPMRIMEIQDGTTTYLENYQASTPPTVVF